MRSTRTTRRSGRSRRSRSRRAMTASSVGKRIELRRVHRDRARDRLRRTARDRRSRLGEQPAPALRVEADEVVRQQSVVDRPAHVGGQDAPAVGAHPRDVDEMHEPSIRTPVPDVPRREIEVVVVEEDRRARIGRELVDDRVGKAAVHLRVPLVPGFVKRSRPATGARTRSQSRCWMNHSIGFATTS